MSLEMLPEVLRQLVPEIEELLDSYYSNRLQTLPVKISNRAQNITVTWNIYPTKKVYLEDLFQILADAINENIKEINGEIIQCNLANGEIRDGRVQEFQIQTGKTWEIYLFDPEIFIFLRLLYESRVDQSHDKWISIDIDIVRESAWFTA